MKIVVRLTCLIVAGTLSFAIAEEHIPGVEDLLNHEPELKNIFGSANFSTLDSIIEGIEKMLITKCDESGGPDAVDTAKNGPTQLHTCFQALGVNLTELKAEMDEAQPHGELDTVFKKYCAKVPDFRRCLKNFTDTIEPCMELAERDNVKIIHNITSSLLEFICHNEGDRIAMFIAAEGVECLTKKQQVITACANETFYNHVPNTGKSVLGNTSLPLLVLDPEHCTDINKFQCCTVIALEECEDPTPANVVDSLLNFIRKETPCKKIECLKSSSTAMRSSFNILSVVITAAILTLTRH